MPPKGREWLMADKAAPRESRAEDLNPVASGLRRLEVLIGGVRSHILEGGPSDAAAAVVFVHGSAGSGRDWEGLAAQVGTFARCVAPDMPGYGESDKPADFDYTADGYGSYLGALLDRLAIRRAHLVLHDLGGAWGLTWAAAHPAALASLTLLNIGSLPGYRWHRFARLYRRRLLGELLLATATRSGVALVLRYGNPRGLPSTFIDAVARQYRDGGTRRAVLRFYRATPDLGAVTERAAESLRGTNPPALVIWGARDPYVPVRYADVQRQYFPRAGIVILPRSGHWPFLDDPNGVADALLPFLRGQQDERAHEADRAPI